MIVFYAVRSAIDLNFADVQLASVLLFFSFYIFLSMTVDMYKQCYHNKLNNKLQNVQKGNIRND